MKQTKFIAVVLLSFIILIMFFSCEDEQPEIPDFHADALQIQEEYRPGFAVRKLKHLLIYCYGLCQEYDVDYEIVKAVVGVESHWNTRSLSSANCKGLMQISKDAASDLQSSQADLYNPYVNLTLGVMYLSWLQEKYNGNQKKVLKAYHDGPGRVDRAGILNYRKDTYVNKVLQLAARN